MKVEILHLKTLKQPAGDLLEVLDVNAHVFTPDQIIYKVGSVLLGHGIKLFGTNVLMVKNSTIFGGHVTNAITGESIIAV